MVVALAYCFLTSPKNASITSAQQFSSVNIIVGSNVTGTCRYCKGNGQCQTCGGEGRIKIKRYDDDTLTDDDEEEDNESYSNNSSSDTYSSQNDKTSSSAYSNSGSNNGYWLIAFFLLISNIIGLLLSYKVYQQRILIYGDNGFEKFEFGLLIIVSIIISTIVGSILGYLFKLIFYKARQ